ncbi:MAG: VCBS repeat-containing protein, partial [Candidatus Latescibacteria bacterium]|nr:VCBS repeat-containing protein [Candidatus Latescibacterota bacterium]
MTTLILLLLLPLSLWGQPRFVDQTREAGLGRPNTCGGPQKRYILESTGSGAAFFDYDQDGRLDLYVVNGSTFEQYKNHAGPGNALYRNRGDGTFAEVTD